MPYFVFRWMPRRKSKLLVFSLLKLVGRSAHKPKQTSLGEKKKLGQTLGYTGHHSDQVYTFVHLYDDQVLMSGREFGR